MIDPLIAAKVQQAALDAFEMMDKLNAGGVTLFVPIPGRMIRIRVSDPGRDRDPRTDPPENKSCLEEEF